MKLLIQWAFTSSALILIVLAVRYLFRNRLSARLKYALWGVVLLRLLVPFQVELPAAASDALPVLASNLAQDVSPRLDDTMLYAVPTERYPSERVQPGEEPEYSRTLHGGVGSDWDYYAGGVRFDENGTTRYAFMMPASELLLVLWKWGAALCLIFVFYSNWCFSMRLDRSRKRLEDVDAPIPVYMAEGLPSPCLFGVFRPAVYVTPEAAANPDTLRHVLAHELTHYAHFDHLWSLLRCLALALHWYNPLVWLAVILSKRDGELACDEGAVARLGESERIPYGRTLVDMVAARSLRPGDLLSCSTAMTGGESSIKRRVAQLVKKPETVRTALFAVIALVALAVVFVFAGRGAAKNETLQNYLDRTTAIRYSPPLYFSSIHPSPISDPDLLNAAKEALSGFTFLGDEDPQPDLSLTKLVPESRITLTFEGGQMDYSLLWQNDRTYLFPGSIFQQGLDLQEEEGETAQLVGVSGTMLSQPGSNVGSVLESLARQQSYRERENLTPATYDYNRYRAQLEAAQAIWLDRTMLHNGNVLTDVKELERVRELLVLTPIPRDGPLEWDEDWTDAIIDAIAFSSTQPGPDWTGADASDGYYIVYTDEDFYYVCSGWDEEGRYYIGTISKENWDRAREILQSAPTVDDRQRRARNATYEGFLDLAEGAVSIQVEAGDGTKRPAITDPEQLELARTALLTADPLPEDTTVLVGASEDWLRHETGSDHYAITLTPEAGDPVTYYINRIPSTNINYIIFPIKEFPVENTQTECSFDRIGILRGPAGYTLWIADNVAAGRFDPPTGLAEPDLSGLTVHR